MNASTFIIATHVAQTLAERADIVFARLGAFAQDEGRTLAAIARLCDRPEIGHHLAGLEALHRDPAGDDNPTIRAAIRHLEALQGILADLPPDPEVTGLIRESDRTLVKSLDAAIRYAGARVEDHLRAMRHLLR